MVIWLNYEIPLKGHATCQITRLKQDFDFTAILAVLRLQEQLCFEPNAHANNVYAIVWCDRMLTLLSKIILTSQGITKTKGVKVWEA